jgi:hypothetical protein
MTAARKSGRLLALAFTAAGLTGAWYAYQALDKPITYDPPAARTPAPASPAAPLPAAGQFQMPPMKDFQAILERPAFSPSRRPKEGAPVLVTEDLAVQVTGITGTPASPLVILVPRDGGDSLILRQGQQYRGWTLGEISSQSVLFRRGEEELRIELAFEAPPQLVPPRPDARQPTGAQRNLRQDRQRQQQSLQQKKLQERQDRLLQRQQNLQRQNQQEQNRQPDDGESPPAN